MEQMEQIRDQQESLAKLHFDIGSKQDPFAPLSEEGDSFLPDFIPCFFMTHFSQRPRNCQRKHGQADEPSRTTICSHW
jgi:hypothetical protein